MFIVNKNDPRIKDMIPITVGLNGTDENPFQRQYGLLMNPFPQIPKYELHNAMMALNALDAIPIPKNNPEEYIRKKLEPHWTKEFVDLALSNYRQGMKIRYRVWIKKEFVE